MHLTSLLEAQGNDLHTAHPGLFTFNLKQTHDVCPQIRFQQAVHLHLATLVLDLGYTLQSLLDI